MIISLYSSKGGVAKTTTTIALLGSMLAKVGARSDIKIAAVDLDPRQNSLYAFGENRKRAGRTDAAVDYIRAHDLVGKSEPLPLVFSALKEDYDFVLADFATGYDVELYHAMMQSDRILVRGGLGIWTSLPLS